MAVHEFGHSLGLSHSSVQGAIMYPYYQSLTSDFKLSSDDITGIQAIYGILFRIYRGIIIRSLSHSLISLIIQAVAMKVEE